MSVPFRHDLVVCDCCLHEFRFMEASWVDSDDQDGAPPPALATRRDKMVHRLFGDPKTPGPGPSRQQLADWFEAGNSARCPNCNSNIPDEVLGRGSLVIGLVGQSGSAKSHYIAALLHLLEAGVLAQQYDITNVFSDATTDRYEMVYAPLFDRDHLVLPGTQPLEDNEQYPPLVVTLRNPISGKVLNARIFDASGEQMKNAKMQARYNKYLYACNALFLFVTPGMLRDVRATLTDDQISGHSASKSAAMFDALASGIQTIAKQRPDAPIGRIRTSVLLTKADQVMTLPGFDPDFLAEIAHGPDRLDEIAARIERESSMLADFLSATGGANIVNSLLTRFSDLTFHAVSSTGCDPAWDEAGPDGPGYPHVTPMRILEPLVMLLRDSGFLEPADMTLAS